MKGFEICICTEFCQFDGLAALLLVPSESNPLQCSAGWVALQQFMTRSDQFLVCTRAEIPATCSLNLLLDQRYA